MTTISGGSVTDERVTCLRIFADAHGETHMEDVDITLQPRKLFKDNPPLRLSDNLTASWWHICHVPAGICEVDWHNPPRLCGVSGGAKRLFNIGAFGELLPIYPTREAGIASVQ